MNNFSIRSKQVDAVNLMLNFNKSDRSRGEVWKILVYDDKGRDVISPLLNVGQLRAKGVTLHLPLHSHRLPVPDVSAIYFVSPTVENIERICQDLKDDLYDAIHINFAGTTPKGLLEKLATNALENDVVSKIARVYDQALNFQALEHDFFSLNIAQSYFSFNDPMVSDTTAEANVARVTDALFSAVVTLGVVPIVRCPRGGAAEMISQRLVERLYAYVAQMGSNFSAASGSAVSAAASTSSYRRPLLVILERTVDRAALLHHPWSYQALVHDCLGLQQNRVRVPVEDEEAASAELAGRRKGDESTNSSATGSSVTIDLEESDEFWAQHRGDDYQDLCVAVKKDLAVLKQQYDKIERFEKSHPSSADIQSQTRDLGSFVASIPELKARKKALDAHTTVATALLRQIKEREIDHYYALEEQVLSKGSCDRQEMKRLMQPDSPGTASDKLRLLLLLFLCADQSSGGGLTSDELKAYVEALVTTDEQRAALAHIRKSPHSEISVPADTSTSGGAASSASSGNYFSQLQKGVVSLSSVSSLFAEGMEKLKTLLPATKEFPVTRIVDALMEHKPMKGVEKYLYFDPKVSPTATDKIPRKTTPFREAVVFMIGGGNYTEYQNLQSYARAGGIGGGRGAAGSSSTGAANASSSTSAGSSSGSSMGSKRFGATLAPTKTIVYGCTELLTASEFIQQISSLGAKV